MGRSKQGSGTPQLPGLESEKPQAAELPTAGIDKSPTLGRALAQGGQVLAAMSVETAVLHYAVMNTFASHWSVLGLSPTLRERAVFLADEWHKLIERSTSAPPNKATGAVIGGPEDTGLTLALENGSAQRLEREHAQRRGQRVTWRIMWKDATGIPLADKSKTEVTSASVWELNRITKENGRRLPDGAVEWCLAAHAGDRATFIDAEQSLSVFIEVDEF